jgi:flagellar biosynthesis/type III secretory pathway protein FliH
MPSSEFTPLLESPAVRVFRPLGVAPHPPMGRSSATAAGFAGSNGELGRAFQAGYELARRELRSDVELVGGSFVSVLAALSSFRARLRERAERELLRVALDVARATGQHEIAGRPELWLGMIRAAVPRAVDRERISVRVPPRLLACLRAALPRLRSTLEEVKDVELIEDPGLSPGGCAIDGVRRG